MDETLKNVLRWVGAAIVMVLVVFVTIPMAWEAITASVQIGDETDPVPGDDLADEDGDGEAGGDGLVAVDQAAAPAVADVSIRNGQVRQANHEYVAIGGVDGDGVILAFEQFEGSPECINIVNVLFTTLEVTPPTELIVAPAAVTDVEGLQDDDDLPDPPYVDEGPTATLEVDADHEGEHRVNVTNLYLAWVNGEVTAEPDAPFTVTLRPTDTLGDRRIQIASVDGGHGTPPRLSWSGVEDCGVPIGT